MKNTLFKRIKKSVIALVVVYLGFLITEHIVLLYKIDKTLDASYYLAYTSKAHVPPPPVYLVSYADKKDVFLKNQNAQAMSAINNGIDHIMMYKRRDIDQQFYQKNKHILDIPTGAGLWIWKPYFILKTMDIAPENSIIIYADSPVLFKKPVTPFINLLEKNDVLLLLDGARRKHKIRTAYSVIKDDPFLHLGLDPAVFEKRDHLSGCLVVVRNNKTSRSFIEKWIKNCEQGHLSTPMFEQSMMIIAAYQKPEGIYTMDIDEAVVVIKNAHRHPNEEYKSLIPDMVSGDRKIFKISEWAYNAKWMQWLRQVIGIGK